MTTSIDELDDLDEFKVDESSIDIFDMTIPTQKRIHILNEFLPKPTIIEYINKLIIHS